MAAAKPDLLGLELEAEMLKRVGSSIKRVKKRLMDTDVTFQLKPPEGEKIEIANWEAKVSRLIHFTDTMSFPKLLDFKRQFAKKELELLREEGERRDKLERLQHERMRKGMIAESRLKTLQEGKIYNVRASTYFGGEIPGEQLRVIENYSGLNTIYGGPHTSTRVLTRKDGRFTKYDQKSDLPPWISAGSYANSDPSMFLERAEGLYKLPFKIQGRRVQPNGVKLREDKIARRDQLDGWKNRDAEPRFAKTPISQSLKWLQSQQKNFNSEEQQALRSKALLRGCSANPPVIFLGDITRQRLLVEVESMLRRKRSPSRAKDYQCQHQSSSLTNLVIDDIPARQRSNGYDVKKNNLPSPSSSTHEIEFKSPAEHRLALYTKFRYSHVHQSPHISAKLEREFNPELKRMHQINNKNSAYQGSKDFTSGGLNVFASTTTSVEKNQEVTPLFERSVLISQHTPPLSELLMLPVARFAETVSDEVPNFSSKETSVAANAQGSETHCIADIRSLPLTSPLSKTIRSDLQAHLFVPPSDRHRSVNCVSGFVSSPEVNIRGLLLSDETDDSSYIAPSVTSLEREAILAKYNNHKSPSSDDISAVTGGEASAGTVGNSQDDNLF